jgi:hypothetical protein
MAMALIENTCVQTALDEYTPAEFAAFAHKNPATVKAWLSNPKYKADVRRYPRGAGNQKGPVITEPGARALARDIGFTDVEIEARLILPHRQRIEARRARVPVPAPERRRGRPPGKPPVTVARKPPAVAARAEGRVPRKRRR